MEQEWLATLDGKTRHEHRMLGGCGVAIPMCMVVCFHRMEMQKFLNFSIKNNLQFMITVVNGG